MQADASRFTFPGAETPFEGSIQRFRRRTVTIVFQRHLDGVRVIGVPVFDAQPFLGLRGHELDGIDHEIADHLGEVDAVAMNTGHIEGQLQLDVGAQCRLARFDLAAEQFGQIDRLDRSLFLRCEIVVRQNGLNLVDRSLEVFDFLTALPRLGYELGCGRLDETIERVAAIAAGGSRFKFRECGENLATEGRCIFPAPLVIFGLKRAE